MSKPYDLEDPKERRLAALDRALSTHQNLDPGHRATLLSAKAYERYLETGDIEDEPRVIGDQVRPSSWP